MFAYFIQQCGSDVLDLFMACRNKTGCFRGWTIFNYLITASSLYQITQKTFLSHLVLQGMETGNNTNLISTKQQKDFDCLTHEI